MNYTIKQKPEDFIVKEVPNKIFNKINGKYLIYSLKKINRNTEDCIQHLSRTLKVPRKYFGFAGTKDHNAITQQYVSVFNVQNLKARITKIKGLENFSLEFIGYLDSPLSLGDLAANKFEITIRALDKKTQIKNPKFIINYFDEQRFSKNNHIIGKAIIKKDFQNAVEELKKQNQINNELIKTYKQDYIKILRLIPKKTLKLFVHAYQSYLFNELCKNIILDEKINYFKVKYNLGELFFATHEPKNYSLPIIGFGSEIQQKNSLVFDLLKKENIDQRDFIIKQIPELSSFGVERELVARVIDFSCTELEEDELNKDKFKTKILFELAKGSYATIVIKKIMEDKNGDIK